MYALNRLLLFLFAVMLSSASYAQPNIIVILADDMGYGDLACQNAESKIPTPNLDRLASQGMRFTDAHSPSAVCTPTRYSLLTGRYAWRTELKSRVLWPWDGPLINDAETTLPELLRDCGYDTACIGKWHLGWNWPTKNGASINDTYAKGNWSQESRQARAAFGANVDFTKPVTGGPVAHGFDYYFGDDVPNFAPYCYIENDRIIEAPTVPKPDDMFGTPGPMVEGWDLRDVMPDITRKAVDYIKAGSEERPFNKSDAPYFLYFSLTAPHTPIAPSDEFIGKTGAHRYGDWVHQVDWTVGQIMKALEETGQADNTIVVFTSDNGSPARDGENMAGRHSSVLEYGHDPNRPWRGMKTDAWEGGHRVPFIVRWPGNVPAGSVSDALIGHNDLMATFADIIDCDIPEGAGVDSFNQRAVLKNADAASARNALIHHSYNGTFAIRKGDWKFIDGSSGGGWTNTNNPEDPPGQLYNMSEDPYETTNLYEELPEKVDELEKALGVIKSQEGSTSRRAQQMNN